MLSKLSSVSPVRWYDKSYNFRLLFLYSIYFFMSIGNGRSLIKCMNADGDPCDGFFSETMLQGALPEKVFQKYSEALARDALKSAHMEGIVTCCHCQIQMLLGPNAGKSDDCHVQYSTVHTYCIYCTYCTFYTCLRSFAQCQR